MSMVRKYGSWGPPGFPFCLYLLIGRSGSALVVCLSRSFCRAPVRSIFAVAFVAIIGMFSARGIVEKSRGHGKG